LFVGFVVAFLRRHRWEQAERKLALRDVWSQLDLVFDNGIGEPLSAWTGLGGLPPRRRRARAAAYPVSMTFDTRT
jgi:hypothetical protein